MVNSASTSTPPVPVLMVAGNVMLFVTPWSVRFPATVCVAFSPPFFTEVDTNVAFGKCSTSKKSFDLRWVTRFAGSV